MTSIQNGEELIHRIVDNLVSGYSPQQVILYGSYACGTPRADSDIDLLIVKETEEPFGDRLIEARKAVERLSSGIPMDLLVMTPGEIEVRLAKGDHFIEDIVRNGRLLYGELTWQEGAVCMPENEPSYAMEWLANGERDIRRARLLLDDEDAGGAGFHLQQALEKILKAFLLSNGWRLQRTHALESLLNEALAFDVELEDLRPLCRRVSDYYLAERYPDSGANHPSLAEVRDSLAATGPLVERLRPAISGQG